MDNNFLCIINFYIISPFINLISIGLYGFQLMPLKATLHHLIDLPIVLLLNEHAHLLPQRAKLMFNELLGAKNM